MALNLKDPPSDFFEVWENTQNYLISNREQNNQGVTSRILTCCNDIYMGFRYDLKFYLKTCQVYTISYWLKSFD